LLIPDSLKLWKTCLTLYECGVAHAAQIDVLFFSEDRIDVGLLHLYERMRIGYNKGFPSSIWATGSTVRVNQTLQLGTETGVTGSPLTYWVNGVKGGNAQLGTVDSNGLYTAPALVPTPDNSVTITSLANAFPQDTPGMVKVSVLNPIPIINSVTPSSFSEGRTDRSG
jgi:hypothetical protein